MDQTYLNITRRFLLAVGLTYACFAQANAAGLNNTTSAYMTIQPNTTGTHLVFTISWAAPDTDEDADGAADAYLPQYGNGTSALFGIASNLEGGRVRTPDSREVQYIYNGINTEDEVQWTDPVNYTVGDTNPTAISREWRNVGGLGANVSTTNIQSYGSGETGVTGVFSSKPDGTGAATGTGVGVVYDWNSASSTDVGFLLSGVSDTPNTGYVQVLIPYPTTTWRNPTTGAIDFGDHTYDASHPFLTGNLIGPAGDTDKFIEGIYTDNSAIEVTVTSDPNYTPKLAVPGDFDGDFDVDSDDLTHAVNNFFGTGLAGFWYADGDMDADGDVDNADLGAIIGAFTPASSSGSAELTYDAATGNVTLDASAAAGSIITSFQLENAVGGFAAGNYTGLSGGDFGFYYQEVAPGTLGDSDLSLAGFSGVADLGNVFPTGLNETELQDFLTTAVYTGTSGSAQQEFNLVVVAASSPFIEWSGGSAADDDDNWDGVVNLIAWVLGAADPDKDALGLLPTLDNTDPDHFVVTFDRSDAAGNDSNTTIEIQYTSDLGGGWTTAEHGVNGIVIDDSSVPAAGLRTVVTTIPKSLAVEGKLFARVKATLVTP